MHILYITTIFRKLFVRHHSTTVFIFVIWFCNCNVISNTFKDAYYWIWLVLWCVFLANPIQNGSSVTPGRYLVRINIMGQWNRLWPLTKEINSRLAKRPLVFNGRLANRGSISLVKDATGRDPEFDAPRLQTVDHRTVRRPYGGSMICDHGMIRRRWPRHLS